jgi:iron complex transport system ATP-binding protein
MIEIHDLTLGYRKNTPVLKNVSLAIGPGEAVNILGPNGCGKTTLLKAMLGFLPVPPECLFLDGRPIEKMKRSDLARRLAYVPQSHHGVFPYTAREVVLMGRTIHSPWLRFSPEDHQQTQAALAKVRMSRLADRSYLELSGGERQLILIARALAQNCSYVIMDEPVGGLDYGHQFHMLDIIKDLAAAGPAIVLTTHHPEQAVFLGGRALLIKEGRLIADGPAEEIVTRPRVCDLYGLTDDALNRVRPLSTA